MLTTTIRKMVSLGFVGLFAAGCIEGQNDRETQYREDSENSIAGVSLVLEQATIQDSGALELSIAFVNEGNQDVCIEKRAIDNSYQYGAEVIAPTKGLVVLGSYDEIGLSVPDLTPSEEARIQRENRLVPVVIKPKGSIHTKTELAPIRGAYFADSKNEYVSRFRRGTPLSVVAHTLFYSCNENNLNEAALEGKAISVKSNALKLVGNISAFISSKL